MPIVVRPHVVLLHDPLRLLQVELVALAGSRVRGGVDGRDPLAAGAPGLLCCHPGDQLLHDQLLGFRHLWPAGEGPFQSGPGVALLPAPAALLVGVQRHLQVVGQDHAVLPDNIPQFLHSVHWPGPVRDGVRVPRLVPLHPGVQVPQHGLGVAIDVEPPLHS